MYNIGMYVYGHAICSSKLRPLRTNTYVQLHVIYQVTGRVLLQLCIPMSIAFRPLGHIGIYQIHIMYVSLYDNLHVCVYYIVLYVYCILYSVHTKTVIIKSKLEAVLPSVTYTWFFYHANS